MCENNVMNDKFIESTAPRFIKQWPISPSRWPISPAQWIKLW